MTILGIETSCDETSAAVVREDYSGNIEVLSNIVSSQARLHSKYGGVVPELAARQHVINIIPVINEALDNANIELSGLVKVRKPKNLIQARWVQPPIRTKRTRVVDRAANSNLREIRSSWSKSRLQGLGCNNWHPFHDNQPLPHRSKNHSSRRHWDCSKAIGFSIHRLPWC